MPPSSLLLSLLLFLVSSAHAESSAESLSGNVTKLRAEFVRLRNIDPTTDDAGTRPLWRSLGQKMAVFLREIGASSTAANTASILRVRLDAASVYARLYRQERVSSDAGHSVELLEPLVEQGATRIPKDIRMEALLLRGDLAVALNEGAREAGQWYSEGYATARSEASPLLAQFQARQQSLSNETYDEFMPSPELETPNLLPSLSQAASATPRITVVLDPGHGGDDSGAVGVAGLLEKEITVDIAQRVKSLLTSHNIRVVLTRESDLFLPLARRTRVANHQGGNVFVSLHVNASPSHSLSGLETYYLDNTDDQAGRKLAERENSVSGIVVDDLSYILGDLIQSGKLEDSIRFARVLDRELVNHVAVGGSGVTSKGVKKGPFFVLVGAHMPCVLVEMLFVDNPDDARRLSSTAFRQKLSQAIAQGILRFVAPHTQKKMTRNEEPRPLTPRALVKPKKRKRK